MEAGKRQEKSTGFAHTGSPESVTGSAQVKSMATNAASPVLKNAPIQDESSNSTGAVSPSPVVLSQLLALQVLLGDYKTVKAEIPSSWLAVAHGKLYIGIVITGHDLAVIEGKLAIDGKPVDSAVKELLEQK